MSPGLKSPSFLDPQLYLLNEMKGTLDTYPYFPGNIKPDFMTVDLNGDSSILAELCINYQLKNDFQFIVIPTRYYSDNPSAFLSQSTEYFVRPFCEYAKSISNTKKILLSVIIKEIMLMDREKRDEILNWITGHQDIDGVYIIFEDGYATKQIKDFDYLLNALLFVHTLKENGLEVYI